MLIRSSTTDDFERLPMNSSLVDGVELNNSVKRGQLKIFRSHSSYDADNEEAKEKLEMQDIKYPFTRSQSSRERKNYFNIAPKVKKR